MSKRIYILLMVAMATVALTSCASKKRKKGEEVGKGAKFYHNLNSKYNGVFNANELMQESYQLLEASHKDNYNELLPVFPYIANDNAKVVAPEMDIVVEKVTRVALIHEVGEYVDDCYVMMAEAQFLKKDYETAEETLQYFQEEFNPNNPYGRGYKKKKKSRKQIKKERNRIKKEREKARQEDKKQREKAKEQRAEEKEAEKEARDAARKQREKEKEAEQKRRKKERETSKKNKSKKRGKPGSKKRPVKTETAAPPSVSDTTTTIDKPIATVAKVEEEPQQDVDLEDEPAKSKKKKEPVDETAYSEGLLWLAKTYTERNNYSSADYILKNLEKKNVQKHVRREIAPAIAHLYIRKGELQEAIPYLEQAIELADSKSDKARYAYIIGQIYQQAGATDAAYKAFARVNKYKPTFDMRFNAELAALKNSILTGERTEESVAKQLDKMSKETKYLEYQDRIYYTVGNIKESLGKDQEALAAYRQSLSASTGDALLKTETYYAMANLYYVEETYVDAKYYYDSTLQTMTNEDLRYVQVKLLAENLSDIARNIETIQLQDSLLLLAGMDEKELRDFATDIARANAEKEQSVADGDLVEETVGKPARGSADQIFGVSDQWPYDLRKVEDGKQAFREKWGDIPLQDNWRRSSEINSIYREDDLAADAEEEKKVEVSDREINEILKAIPKNPNDIVAANKTIEQAMYELGVLYRDKLEKNEKSIATLQDLLVRYPESTYKLDAYYNIYLNYIALGDVASANRYLAMITEEFGETSLAKTLNDPDYGKNKLTDEQRILAFYEDTYRLYDQGQYEEVSQRVSTASSAFDNDYGLKPKFALLNAMSLGKLNGKEAYKAALTDMITRYDGTPEVTRAKEILRFLKGDGEAFEQLDIKEVDDIFKQEDDRRHYLLLVTYKADNEAFINTKIAVSNYNKKYHKAKKLQLNETYLDKDAGTRVILVRQFDGKTDAMKYYEEIVKAKEEFVGTTELNYDVYTATQGNYRRIIQERSTSKYKVFYDAYYLGKKD